MRMPFGKHKGTEVEDVPPDYLRWCVDNVPMYPDLLQAVCDELGIPPHLRPDPKGAEGKRREPPPGPRKNGALDVEACGEIIKLGYRAAALKHHPDAGGSTERMARVNTAFEDLKRIIGVSL